MTEHVNPDDLVKQVVAEVQETYGKLDKKTADLGEVIDLVKKSVEEKADTTDLENTLKGLREEIKGLAQQADEVDKKITRPGGGAAVETKTAGQLMAESDEYKRMAERRGGEAILQMKAITSLESPDVRNPLQTVQTVPGIIREPDRPLSVRDLLPVGTTSSLTIEYPREDVFTNNAASALENTLKPESALTFTASKSDVTTIAHWIPASKQVLADASFLQGYIDNRLREGLRQEEENQLLSGTGANGDLLGLVPQATAYDATGIPAAANKFDAIRWSKLQVRKSFYSADAVVLNPEDWAAMELLKDADGNYLHASVTAGAQPRLWGMRVVESDALAVGSFVVGAFTLAAQVWDREEASVKVSTEDRDNFVKNMVTILAEERLALTVYRPKSFVTGTFPV